MKPKSYLRNALAVAGGLSLAVSVAAAADLTWDHNADGTASDGAGTWLNVDQWLNGGIPATWNNITPDNAIIGSGGTGGVITIGNVTAGTISLNDFSGAYTLQGIASPTILTQSGGITIGADAGNVTFSGNSATNTLTISGAGGLTMNGSGLLSIRQNLVMTYTGPTVINNGVVMLGNAANRSTGNFTLNGGMLTDYYRQTHIFSDGLGTGTNQIQIYGESGFGGGNANSNWRIGALNSVLTWGALGEGAATGYFNATTLKFRAPLGDNNGPSIYGQATLQNRIDLNGGARTIDVYAGETANAASMSYGTIGAGIQDTGGTGSLTKTGEGTLILGGTTSTWGGNTTVSAGRLDFGGTNIANIGGGSGRNISVAAGAVVRFNALNNAVLNRIVETTDEITIMTGTITTGAIDLSSSAGATLPNAFLGNWASNGGMTNISGTATITPGSDGYKFGSVSSNGKLGIAINLADVGGATKLTIGGNRVQLTGNNTFSGETFVRDGARLLIGNANALQNSPLNTGTSTNTGLISFANGAAGGTTPGAQTVPNAVIGGLTGSRNLSTMINQGNATATTNGNAGNNSPTLARNSITGITLNPGSGLAHTYSGAIGDVTGSSTAFTVTMAATAQGTQELTGVNTYTGATSINGGTLLISGSGSINSSSGVIVDGGSLRYNSSVALTSALTFTSGTISGTNLTGASFDNQVINTGKTISPGNSPGTMSVGSQEWAGGGSYLWEINNVTGAAGTDPGWDLLSGTGALTISATDLNPFNILLTSLDIFNNAGDAANFSDASSYSWMIADFTGEITTFAENAFALNASAFSNDFTGTFDIVRGDASGIGGDNTQIWVTYTAIPEPQTAILSALGVLLLLRRKRS